MTLQYKNAEYAHVLGSRYMYKSVCPIFNHAASFQEQLQLEKYFLNLFFAVIIQERLLIESATYWRGYGK